MFAFDQRPVKHTVGPRGAHLVWRALYSYQHNYFANIACMVIRPLDPVPRRPATVRGPDPRDAGAPARRRRRPAGAGAGRAGQRADLVAQPRRVAAGPPRRSPSESVVVSGELARNPAQLLGVLVARIAAARGAGRHRAAGGSQELQALALPDGPFGQVVQPAILMELVDLLGDRLAALDRGVCLMIDGISPTVAHAVFGSLRNELWALDGAAWVVAGDTAAEAALPRAAGRRVLRADGRARARSPPPTPPSSCAPTSRICQTSRSRRR